MLECVKSFANNMLKPDEESDNGDREITDVNEEKRSGNVSKPDNSCHAELMAKFQSVSSSTTGDLLQNMLSASMCLESADKGCIKRSVSGV